MTLHARAEGVHRPAHPSGSLAGAGQADVALRALRQRLELAIEAAIALLDCLDAPAEDLEPDADWEPWLAVPEGHERQLPWCWGCDDDREAS